MRNVLKLVFVILFILNASYLFAQTKEKVVTKGQKVKMKSSGNPDLPYVAKFSSDISIGDVANSAIVLKIWKGYDENNWDVLAEHIADSVTFILSDGTIIKGKDGLLTGIKQYRSQFQTVSSTVDAWVPFKFNDKNQQGVGIWGTETDIKTDGNKQSMDLHEVWLFNSSGKIYFIRQYQGQVPKM